ncbi:hypothetical protein [Marinobacter pelagius]|uniref:Sulfotransferase family protein n=1 Tax=Marinobacter pelagius TaxID=379482 RepID=A0A1I4U0B4_9GAMM|nr:hypothetical protein [Marinobacter pelagius]SFM82173.1 hypothetical protein SAMN04487961_1371 [Marinobacter pelagius]
MHDFGDLVYLDVHKTGSGFVSKFLSAIMPEREVSRRKHARIGERVNGEVVTPFKPDATYFITARNPFSQYLSLYKFGLAKRGSLYTTLQKRGKADLYSDASADGFFEWLDLVLDPKNSHLLGGKYKLTDVESIGLMSFRFIALSMSDPLAKIKGKKYSEVSDIFHENRIWSFMIRQEGLTDNLKKAVDNELVPWIADREYAKSVLDEMPVDKPGLGFKVKESEAPRDLLRRLIEKEDFLYRNFYNEKKLALEKMVGSV